MRIPPKLKEYKTILFIKDGDPSEIKSIEMELFKIGITSSEEFAKSVNNETLAMIPLTGVDLENVRDILEKYSIEYKFLKKKRG